MRAETDLETCDHTVKILLVEDQKADIMLIKRALSKNGIINPLYVVRDGEQALAYLNGVGDYTDRATYPLPDLILLDLKMPKINGLEVLRQLKQMDGLKRIPVIVLTSSGLNVDVNTAYDLGANSYLVKPVQVAEFFKVAREIKYYWLMLNLKPTGLEA